MIVLYLRPSAASAYLTVRPPSRDEMMLLKVLRILGGTVASIRKAGDDSVTSGSDRRDRTTTSVELADDDPRIWGWHHSGDGKSLRTAGVVIAVVLVLMGIGTHEGFVENLWLYVVAAILIAMSMISSAGRRRSTWRQ